MRFAAAATCTGLALGCCAQALAAVGPRLSSSASLLQRLHDTASECIRVDANEGMKWRAQDLCHMVCLLPFRRLSNVMHRDEYAAMSKEHATAIRSRRLVQCLCQAACNAGDAYERYSRDVNILLHI